ncbi:putative lipid II flippase FtsW [Cognatilysobacter lacus]|uniref:Probable peptidoglycan glycosyltransferase FtsW n=1 Tax=Cognatilysobacter lacus TaxID=1643323 RepID=A0A5D8YMA5_9GAMM|nr:putative lipid II flippase FtsW [Lysobacter lacus]TZF83427.1 putative lipid II flippase FtsW [Lysobacter lacus]
MMDTSRQATRFDAITGRFDPWLLGLIGALLCLGVVMVGSASVAQAASPTYYLTKHLFFIVAGGIAAAWVMRMELRTIERYAPWLPIIGVVLLLMVAVPGLGVTVKGAKRWVNLGVVNFQPVEAVKLMMVVWLAAYLKRFSEEVSASWKAIIKVVGVACAFAGVLLAVQKDFGSSALILAMTAGMLVLGGANLPRLVGPLFALLPALGAMILLEPYRVRRMTSFTDPFKDPFGDGYQLANALMAVGRGEWFGAGLGASVHKLSYLPEAHTDFIMAVIAEELGFVGVCAVIALYAALVGRALWVGLKCVEMRRHFAGYCAFGIALWIGIQSTVSIGVNLGLLPTKGLTLPLISYGGSSIAMTMAAMGLLLRISYELERARRQVALRRDTAATPSPTTHTTAARPAAPAPAAGVSPLGRNDPRGTNRLRPRVEPTFGRHSA